MLTLDSLSLLLSKQSPTQAGLTLSQQLREMVGIGTLGADKLDEPIIHPNKARDEEEVATGWTLMQINQARDAAEEAGKFLQREVEAESKYWEDVMAVKKAGWSICRVPREHHTLGVKFGFSEGESSQATYIPVFVPIPFTNKNVSCRRIQKQWPGADEKGRQWLSTA